MAVDLLVFDNEGHVTEVSLVKDGDEVLLEVDVRRHFRDDVGVSLVLSRSTFFCD